MKRESLVCGSCLAILAVLACLLAFGIYVGNEFVAAVRPRYAVQWTSAFVVEHLKVAPPKLMQNYSAACGLTDVEAFFLVQALKSDQTLDLGFIPRSLGFFTGLSVSRLAFIPSVSSALFLSQFGFTWVYSQVT